MLQSFLGLLPVLLFNFNLRLHEHENRVVTDAEILSECLFEEVISGAHISSIGIDDGGEQVSFDNGRVLTETVIDFSQSSSCVSEEPSSLSEENLGLSKS